MCLKELLVYFSSTNGNNVDNHLQEQRVLEQFERRFHISADEEDRTHGDSSNNTSQVWVTVLLV